MVLVWLSAAHHHSGGVVVDLVVEVVHRQLGVGQSVLLSSIDLLLCVSVNGLNRAEISRYTIMTLPK